MFYFFFLHFFLRFLKVKTLRKILSIVFILSTVAFIGVGINGGFSPLTFENFIDVFTLWLSPV